MSELFDSGLMGFDPHPLDSSSLVPDLDDVFTGMNGGGSGTGSKKMDLLSASIQDAGILRSNNEDWLMDNETDDLLNSILTGNDDHLLGSSAAGLTGVMAGDATGAMAGVLSDGTGGSGSSSCDDSVASSCSDSFDRQLLSPTDSNASSGGNSSCNSSNAAAANNIDLMDMFPNEPSDEDETISMQGVNPHTALRHSSTETHARPAAAQQAIDDLDELPPIPSLLPISCQLPVQQLSQQQRPKQLKQQQLPGTGAGAPRVMLKAHRSSSNPKQRIASTNVYHHAGVAQQQQQQQQKPSISVVRPTAITTATAAAAATATATLPVAALQPTINATPITLASATGHTNTSLETGTTTIYLPVLNAKSVQQPTIIRMNAPPIASSKRRRVSACSSDSGSDDGSSVSSEMHPRFPTSATDKNCKYPRLELNDEERKLCDKEGIVLPSHYPLTKEEERNLKRIRRKIRNKQSAQDSRKRKKEHVENMEARAMKCAQENAELVKKLSMLEAQNKTLVGQLKRLHQIIVNKGGIPSTNAVAQAAMGHNNKGQTSTAFMVLLLSTALFLIPGMKEQLETKPSLDISQAVKGPPIPGQSRSLLQFTPQNIKEEYPANTAAAPSQLPQTQSVMNNAASASENAAERQLASNKKKTILSSSFGDHDYVTLGNGVMTSSAAAAAKVVVKPMTSSIDPMTSYKKPEKKKQQSYIVADVPPLGYGGDHMMLDIHRSDISQEVVVVTTAMDDGEEPMIKQEVVEMVEDAAEEAVGRRLNVSVSGGLSGPRTVVLTVPKGLK